jgi:putative methyltransferase (TIGR01177 family)
MHLILLSAENIELSRTEAESLLGLENTSILEHYLICTIPTKNLGRMQRLACTKRIYEVLYSTNIKNLEASLEAYPWKNHYKKDFCVRIDSEDPYDEKYYAKFVWRGLEKKKIRPKVNLDKPDLLIQIVIRKNTALVCRFIYENLEDFESRKAHFRPVLHPTAMHPKMARSLINILNPSPKETVIDPFCGVCGILTEAGLMDIRFTGYDIEKNMLDSAKTNLKYYKISPRKYKLIKKDATTIKSLKNVVTDLPYGLSSKKSEDLDKMYAKFIKNISGKAVVVMPDFMEYKKLLKDNLSKKLKVDKIIDYYVHKSLTRKIIIIGADKKKKR